MSGTNSGESGGGTSGGGDGGPLMYKSGIFSGGRLARAERRALGSVDEPARSVPVFRECDVLVVGGGPSGTAAAVAAARTGADVILRERANHLGGLSTGGLVIWIDRPPVSIQWPEKTPLL